MFEERTACLVVELTLVPAAEAAVGALVAVFGGRLGREPDGRRSREDGRETSGGLLRCGAVPRRVLLLVVLVLGRVARRRRQDQPGKQVARLAFAAITDARQVVVLIHVDGLRRVHLLLWMF